MVNSFYETLFWVLKPVKVKERLVLVNVPVSIEVIIDPPERIFMGKEGLRVSDHSWCSPAPSMKA